MPRKRRKLNKDFEKSIYFSNKKIELVLAKINDINDEDIQKEYLSAFENVIGSYADLKQDYDLLGFNDRSDSLEKVYQDAIFKFESEFEL